MEMEITVKRTGSAPTRLQKPPISAPASRELGLLSRPGFFLPVALCLVAAVFVVYAPTLDYQFIVDDHFFTSDPRVQTSGHVWEYFTDYVWAEYDGGPATFYRPLFILWTRLNFILCGLSPWGWHLLSIAKHVLVAVLLGMLAWKLLRDRFAALIAATLFALHPSSGRISGVGYGARPSDVRRRALHLAPLLQVCEGPF